MSEEYQRGRQELAVELRKFLEVNFEKDEVIDLIFGQLDAELEDKPADTTAREEGQEISAEDT